MKKNKTQKVKKGSVKSLLIMSVVFTSFLIVVFAKVNEARPDYGMGSGVFSSLPPMPDDFLFVVQKMNSTMVYDVGKEYYKQPEFYPTFDKFIPFIKNPPNDRIAIWGVGMYPSRHEYNIGQDNSINIVTYLHSSWLVQTYQGAKLEAEYDRNYFDVSVYPDTILLGPAYPKFDENWTQKVTVNVHVKSAPPGSYSIAINPRAPSDEKTQEWHNKYGGLYVSMPASSPEQPYMKITVNVQ